ncbi:histidine kinase, partial [Aureobasidium melanogenum]
MPNPPTATPTASDLDTQHHRPTEDKKRSHPDPHHFRPPPPPPRPPTSAANTTSLPADKSSSVSLQHPSRPPVFQSVSSDAIDAPPLRKKPRLLPRHERFTFTGPSINRLQPPSPLFFSNSPRPRPHLPPRFTSFEAGATMLSKANNEESHVKTVTLARGTISNSLRRSIDRSSTARSASPDLRGELSLNSIGILELLDHDDRPAIIVDLADGTHTTEPSLRPIFTNRALRSSPDLLSALTGVGRDQDETAFAQFKAWVLGSQASGEPLSVPLPTHVYAGTSWSCSTLRRRLRIISGASAAMTSNGALATSASRHSSNSTSTSAMSIPQSSSSLPISSSALPATVEEPDDYFGSAAPAPTSAPAPAEISPSIIPSTEAADAKAQSTWSGSLSLDSRKISPLGVHDTTLLDTHPSFLNEQVLCAQTAGNVDWFDSSSAGFSQEGPSFDWTRLPVSDSMPPHIKFARSIEWEKTPLGSIEGWSSDLRQMCNLIMASPHPAAMYWGQELVAIYNEAYVMLAGQKHPALMGQRYADAWSEIWPDVKDVFANALNTGEATMKDDDRLFIMRGDYLEETYFSWSIIPMVGGDGSVMGLYNPAFEKTRRKLAERRMITLREIGERTAPARDVKGFWSQVLAALDLNEHDTPFVMLYSVQDETDSDASSMHSSSAMTNRQCILEGTLGVPEDHHAAVSCFDLKGGMEGLGPVFREVMKTDKPVLLEVGTDDLPAKLLEGLGGRGFDDSCRNVVICPIHPTTGEAVLGFLVMGVNPRRPYDEDYSLFIQLLNRQLATSLASVVLFEEEIRRGQKAAKLAAIDRMELSEQLAARTQEAIESETKFTRMAEFAPVGMFIADSEGTITYCNDTWFEISRVSRDENTPDHHWMDAVNDEDRELINKLWHDLIVEKKPQTGTFRFKSKWHGSEGLEGDRWVLFSAYPEKYEDGKLKSVFGSLTDISKQKWAEGFQKRKMEEAVELKRQQENFIDITSHEMRNPLSAILQCADEITTTMSRLRDGLAGQASLVSPIDKFLSKNQNTETIDGILSSTVDSAQTIALCAQHQKRIVDDILTLSKLDSQLLLVTPVDAQPLTVAQRALKMHEGELQTADIQLKFVVDDSYKKLGIDWVKFDPSRVLQVLINLTTNAIKFTTTEKKRTITVTLAAATKRFSELENRVVNYFPTRNKHADLTKEKDWGDGEEVYIHFAVQDTGRGLNEQEKKMLFLRFSQASPRTHVQYGGSGLGLFISRELTELQGGEIGVASEFGVGSTFAFWVKAKRSSAPPEAEGLNRPAVRAASDATGKKVPTVVNAKAESSVARPIKVLIVEDNIVNARVLSKQLKNLGCVVHVANHGGEALDILRKSNYWNHQADTENTTPESERIGLSVVLMDQEMPIMDGLTCTRKIREFEKEGKFVRHVPVIAVTANARNEQIETAMSAGMDDVMPKPFRIPELIPKIEELMSKYPED